MRVLVAAIAVLLICGAVAFFLLGGEHAVAGLSSSTVAQNQPNTASSTVVQTSHNAYISPKVLGPHNYTPARNQEIGYQSGNTFMISNGLINGELYTYNTTGLEVAVAVYMFDNESDALSSYNNMITNQKAGEGSNSNFTVERVYDSQYYTLWKWWNSSSASKPKYYGVSVGFTSNFSRPENNSVITIGMNGSDLNSYNTSYAASSILLILQRFHRATAYTDVIGGGECLGDIGDNLDCGSASINQSGRVNFTIGWIGFAPVSNIIVGCTSSLNITSPITDEQTLIGYNGFYVLSANGLLGTTYPGATLRINSTGGLRVRGLECYNKHGYPIGPIFAGVPYSGSFWVGHNASGNPEGKITNFSMVGTFNLEALR